MAIFDLILLIFLGGFIVLGFFTGLFQSAGAIMGLLVGYWFASRYYQSLGDFFEPILFGHSGLSNLIAFVFILMLVVHLIGLMVWFFAKTMKILEKHPYYHLLNRLGGAVLGFVEGLFVIGIVLVAIEQISLTPALVSAMANSALAPIFLQTAGLLDFVLPAAYYAFETFGP
ncbi:MAG: CvpA family protein [bacterium]|nr:CvpA family protein [bacterium]